MATRKRTSRPTERELGEDSRFSIELGETGARLVDTFLPDRLAVSTAENLKPKTQQQHEQERIAAEGRTRSAQSRSSARTRRIEAGIAAADAEATRNATRAPENARLLSRAYARTLARQFISILVSARARTQTLESLIRLAPKPIAPEITRLGIANWLRADPEHMAALNNKCAKLGISAEAVLASYE